MISLNRPRIKILIETFWFYTYRLLEVNYLFIYVPISIYLAMIYLSIYDLSLYLTIYLSIYLSIDLYIYLSIVIKKIISQEPISDNRKYIIYLYSFFLFILLFINYLSLLGTYLTIYRNNFPH